MDDAIRSLSDAPIGSPSSEDITTESDREYVQWLVGRERRNLKSMI
ncbi:hypothetical protein [Halorubrum halophilum]|nr:hypothetical protein [Halorubrum halophilum]